MKQRRFRRIQVFCRDILLQRAAAEGDHPPARVRDRKHHAVAEAIVGNGDVVAGDQQARFDHVLGGNAVGAEMLLQGETFARRIADAELHLRGRRDRAVGEIAARPGAVPRGQRVGEEFCRELHHVMQRLAALLMARGIGRRRRHRHPGHRGQPLDRFGERDALGLHHEVKNVAVPAGGEVVVKALLVVDRERRRLLLLKRRQPLPLPPGLLQLDALAHDFRNRKPGAQLVEELGRKAHAGILRFESRDVVLARWATGHGYREGPRKYEDYRPSRRYSQGPPAGGLENPA